MTGTRITKIGSTGLKLTNAKGGIVTNDACAIFDDTSTPAQVSHDRNLPGARLRERRQGAATGVVPAPTPCSTA
jgi:hypothetical protein